MVPVTGLEPVRHRWRRILSPLRLPFHHTGDYQVIILLFLENSKQNFPNQGLLFRLGSLDGEGVQNFLSPGGEGGAAVKVAGPGGVVEAFQGTMKINVDEALLFQTGQNLGAGFGRVFRAHRLLLGGVSQDRLEGEIRKTFQKGNFFPGHDERTAAAGAASTVAGAIVAWGQDCRLLLGIVYPNGIIAIPGRAVKKGNFLLPL